MKRSCFLLFICLSGPGIFSAFSQETDSTVQNKIRIPPYLRWINEESFQHDRLRNYTLDTSINTIHLVNNMEINFRSYLANNGSASDPGLFGLSPVLYSYAGLPGYDFLLKKSSDVRYYRTNKRFTEITYFSGGRKEQTIKVLHTQNIFKNWNVGIDFTRSGAWGYLLHSRTFQSSLDLYSWYHTKNNRYHVLAHAIWEAVKNEVNGGVKSDSLYDNTDLNAQQMQGLSVNISGAENHVKSRIYSLKQFFDLGSKSDFDTTIQTFKYKPNFRLGLTSKLERYSFAYIDGTNDSDYYENTFYNDTGKDSLYSQNIRNEFSISHSPSDSGTDFKKIFYSAGIAYQWFEYRQRSIDTAFQNAGLTVEIRSPESDSTLSAGAKGEYIVAGDNSGSYHATGFVKLPVRHAGAFTFSVEAGKYNPEVFFQKYYSNHFIRERQSNAIPFVKTGFRYANKPLKLEAGAGFWRVTNFAYFDYEALPSQFSPAIHVTQVYLKKKLAWRRLRFDNTLWFQHVNEDSILHIPSFCSYHALYYSVPAFKKAMHFEAGIDAHVQSRTYGNDFMPSTAFFFTQNEIKTGGYVLLNLFFNFRIKTADLFLKLENMGNFVIDNKYYLVPHQPMQLRTFKVGVRWRFYDQ